MRETSEYCVVITTCGNRESAERIASLLLAERLAACVQILNITSLYTWKEETAKDDEALLLIKAKTSLYPEIEACISHNHTYEVPEVIQLAIDNGSSSYLKWISEVSK